MIEPDRLRLDLGARSYDILIGRGLLATAGRHLQPLLRQFMDAYPDIRLELRIDNAFVDIVAAGFDAGIRFGDFVEKDMVARIVQRRGGDKWTA